MKPELSKERLQEIAEHEIGSDAYPRRAEWQAMARALLAAHEQEPDYIRYDCGCCGFETLEEWRDNDVCPKCNHKPMGKTELFTHPAPSIPAAAPEEIVGWVREENGDGRDPLFLCGSVKPDMGKAYNSQYFPVKRAAMLKHSAPVIVTSDRRMMEMPKAEDIDAIAAMLNQAPTKAGEQ